MGEYAIRKLDGERIKIGTCEEMYYLRFEDRNKVKHEHGNVDPNDDEQAGGLRFRLPFPDEDDIPPGGNYEHYERGLRLYRMVKSETTEPDYCEDFTDPETVNLPGFFQLHHPSGLILNVPCYHGEKLPQVAEPMRAFWNGRSWFLELSKLRGVYSHGKLTLWPVVRCRHCGEQWRYKWSDIWDYIPADMKERLQDYKEAIENDPQPTVA